MVEKKKFKEKKNILLRAWDAPVSSLVIPAGAAATILTRRGGMRRDGSAVLAAIGHIGDRGFNIYKLS